MFFKIKSVSKMSFRVVPSRGSVLVLRGSLNSCLTHVSSCSTILAAGVGEAQLVVDWATPADTGIYLCHAINEVSAIVSPARTALVVPRKYIYKTVEWLTEAQNIVLSVNEMQMKLNTSDYYLLFFAGNRITQINFLFCMSAVQLFLSFFKPHVTF